MFVNCVFIADDFTSALTQQRDIQSIGGISTITEQMFMGQKVSMGVIAIVHSYSSSSKVALQNSKFFIITGLPQEDPNYVCGRLDLTPQQANKIRHLDPGDFVIVNPMIHNKPVLAHFDEPDIPEGCSESLRKCIASSFLKSIKAKKSELNKPDIIDKPEDTEVKKSEPDLTDKTFLFLFKVALEVPTPATTIYSQLNISRTEARRIVKKLESSSIVIAHRFGSGHRGGRYCFYEITEYGWQLLNGRKIYRPKSLTNGNFEHELAAKLLKYYASLQKAKIKFEVQIENMRLDAGITDTTNGSCHYYNIGVTNPTREVDSIEKYFKLPVSKQVLFTLIARDTKFVKQVQQLTKQRKISQDIIDKFEIKKISDFVNL